MTNVPSGALTGGCHCGRISIRVPGRPDNLNICNCTLCTKLGGIWAYFPASLVEISGETLAYTRPDIADPYLSTHFCGGCGATTHWSPLAEDAPDRMGVNMRLFEPAELIGLEVRYGNMRDDEGRGYRRYYREPTIFGEQGVPA